MVSEKPGGIYITGGNPSEEGVVAWPKNREAPGTQGSLRGAGVENWSVQRFPDRVAEEALKIRTPRAKPS